MLAHELGFAAEETEERIGTESEVLVVRDEQAELGREVRESLVVGSRG